MKPTIQTRSGRYFDFLNPDITGISIDEIAHALSNICRFTGHVIHHYSVAQHSVLVSRLVPPEYALAGLLHDAPEAFLGDVASPLKALLPDYRAIEDRVEAAVLGHFGLPPHLPPEVKHADLRALATERRDLMPPPINGDDTWALLNGIEPHWGRIVCMTPAKACDLFLDRYFTIAYEKVA